MSSVLAEGELEFDFVGAEASRLDRANEAGVPQPEGMMLADFVVAGTTDTLLVEVKDPSHSQTPASQVRAYALKLQTKELVPDLVQKARDSYTFLHLMARDDRPMLFVVVLGLERVAADRLLPGPLKERLLRGIRQEASEPWKREYVSDCVVLTTENWTEHFPDYGLSRRAGA